MTPQEITKYAERSFEDFFNSIQHNRTGIPSSGEIYMAAYAAGYNLHSSELLETQKRVQQLEKVFRAQLDRATKMQSSWLAAEDYDNANFWALVIAELETALQPQETNKPVGE